MYFKCCIFYVFLIDFVLVRVWCRRGVIVKGAKFYTNNWSVRVTGGRDVAEKIARKEEFEIEDEEFGFDHIYKFHHPRHPKRVKYANDQLTDKLSQYDEVSWVQQEAAVERKSRNFPDLLFHSLTRSVSCPRSEDPTVSSHYGNIFNDHYFPRQWYLQECRQSSKEPQIDLNVVPVWLLRGYKYFGKGVKVVVIDDGFQTNHSDLRKNYNSQYGLDLQDGDRTPDPEYRKFSHGTRCGGVIGMEANNTMCGVGIAPEVTLGAVRLLGPNPSSDFKDGQALGFQCEEVDIYSNSWGPNDNGKTLEYLGPLTEEALKNCIAQGRNGKGSIYVYAAGNGKWEGDMCGCDPYVNSIYTIAVASCDQNGKITEYSERCPAVMVTTYSGDKSTPYNVVTTDVGETSCTLDHTGTSASAPMVSGAIALALEANPKLTYRDIFHLIAWSTEIAPLQNNEKTWVENKAGFVVSPDFGFGLMNIFNFVRLAKYFKPVPPVRTCISIIPFKSVTDNGSVLINRARSLKIAIEFDACDGKPSQVKYIEHIQLVVDIDYSKRGDLQIALKSPKGTKARLLETRPKDSSTYGFRNWSFSSIMTWGECPAGTWYLRIFDKTGHWTNEGQLNAIMLIVHGTKEKPKHYSDRRSYYDYDKSRLVVDEEDD